MYFFFSSLSYIYVSITHTELCHTHLTSSTSSASVHFEPIAIDVTTPVFNCGERLFTLPSPLETLRNLGNPQRELCVLLGKSSTYVPSSIYLTTADRRIGSYGITIFSYLHSLPT